MMAFSFSSHEYCGSPLVPRQYIVTFSGILSALSVSLCGGILSSLLEPMIHWGSCHSMASQLLLEGCVDAWCFFSAELFDWRNIRITSELRGLRLQPIISSSGLLSWCTNPWRSPQHWRVRLVSHSLNSTPYHEIDWNVGNFSKT